MKNLRPLLSVYSAPAISEPVSKVPYDIIKVAKSNICRVVYPPGSFTHRFLSSIKLYYLQYVKYIPIVIHYNKTARILQYFHIRLLTSKKWAVAGVFSVDKVPE